MSERTLEEVFEFDTMTPEEKREALREAALSLGLDEEEHGNAK